MKLTESGVGLGQVAELEVEGHALAVGVGLRRDLALDVAAINISALEVSFLGQSRLVHNAHGVVGHDRGISELLSTGK